MEEEVGYTRVRRHVYDYDEHGHDGNDRERGHDEHGHGENGHGVCCDHDEHNAADVYAHVLDDDHVHDGVVERLADNEHYMDYLQSDLVYNGCHVDVQHALVH